MGSAVTMNRMFFDSSFNNGGKDLATWDQKKLKETCGMFRYSDFKGRVSAKWFKSIERANAMFSSTPFSQNLEDFDFTSIKNAKEMFSHSGVQKISLRWNIKIMEECPEEFENLFMKSPIETSELIGISAKEIEEYLENDLRSNKKALERLNGASYFSKMIWPVFLTRVRENYFEGAFKKVGPFEIKIKMNANQMKYSRKIKKDYREA